MAAKTMKKIQNREITPLWYILNRIIKTWYNVKNRLTTNNELWIIITIRLVYEPLTWWAQRMVADRLSTSAVTQLKLSSGGQSLKRNKKSIWKATILTVTGITYSQQLSTASLFIQRPIYLGGGREENSAAVPAAVRRRCPLLRVVRCGCNSDCVTASSSASEPVPCEVGIAPNFRSTPRCCELAGPWTVRILPGSATLERWPPPPPTIEPVGWPSMHRPLASRKSTPDWSGAVVWLQRYLPRGRLKMQDWKMEDKTRRTRKQSTNKSVSAAINYGV